MEKANLLEFEVFCKVLEERLRGVLGSEADVEYTKITKNNGVVYNAILVRRHGENVSPTIYLEQFYKTYQNGAGFDKVVDEFVEIYRESLHNTDFDVSFFMDFSRVSEHLSFRVVNYKKNKSRLDNVPIRRCEDLAFVPLCVIDDIKDQTGTIVINNQHLDLWEVSEEELWENVYENAEKNAPLVVKGIEEFVSLRTGIRIDEMIPNIYVVSNKSLCYGAATVFFPGVLKQLSEKLRGDVLIIPSSVHETIILGSSGCLEMDSHLIDIVKEVNETTLSSEEILSDNVYYYSAKEDKVESIKTMLERSNAYSLEYDQ